MSAKGVRGLELTLRPLAGQEVKVPVLMPNIQSNQPAKAGPNRLAGGKVSVPCNAGLGSTLR